jgi:hypothetical protein
VVGTFVDTVPDGDDTGIGPSSDGSVTLFLGSAASVDSSPAWRIESKEKGSLFGSSVAADGDMDDDGFDDILVGAPGHTLAVGGAKREEGAVSLYLGSALVPNVAADWLLEGTIRAAHLGAQVASVGDVNRCGGDDVLVGAPDEDVYFDEGTVYFLTADSVANGLPDADADGVPDLCDLCVDQPDPAQEDGDADGIGDVCDPCPPGVIDADKDGYCVAVDCDDHDPAVFPGAVEQCDGKDTACIGSAPTDERDDDGDGIRTCSGDCNDADGTVHPGAVELCDGLDNTCSGAVPTNELDPDGDGTLPCEMCDGCEPEGDGPTAAKDHRCGDCSHGAAAPSTLLLLAALCVRRRSERS